MRLNLPRHNCISFSVSSQFTMSKEKDAAIQEFMERTLTRFDEDDDGEAIAASLYGSVSRAGGFPHRVTALLTKKSHENGADISLTAISERDEGINPPPRELRSVNDLIEAAPDLFGHIEVSCRALFEYERERGFESKIHFPIPLIVQDGGDGITHIESAQFSCRNADGIVYAIAVEESDDGAGIAHTVDFDSTVALGQNQIRNLFGDAASMSSKLISSSRGGG